MSNPIFKKVIPIANTLSYQNILYRHGITVDSNIPISEQFNTLYRTLLKTRCEESLFQALAVWIKNTLNLTLTLEAYKHKAISDRKLKKIPPEIQCILNACVSAHYWTHPVTKLGTACYDEEPVLTQYCPPQGRVQHYFVADCVGEDRVVVCETQDIGESVIPTNFTKQLKASPPAHVVSDDQESCNARMSYLLKNKIPVSSPSSVGLNLKTLWIIPHSKPCLQIPGIISRYKTDSPSGTVNVSVLNPLLERFDLAHQDKMATRLILQTNPQTEILNPWFSAMPQNSEEYNRFCSQKNPDTLVVIKKSAESNSKGVLIVPIKELPDYFGKGFDLVEEFCPKKDPETEKYKKIRYVFLYQYEPNKRDSLEVIDGFQTVAHAKWTPHTSKDRQKGALCTGATHRRDLTKTELRQLESTDIQRFKAYIRHVNYLSVPNYFKWMLTHPCIQMRHIGLRQLTHQDRYYIPIGKYRSITLLNPDYRTWVLAALHDNETGLNLWAQSLFTTELPKITYLSPEAFQESIQFYMDIFNILKERITISTLNTILSETLQNISRTLERRVSQSTRTQLHDLQKMLQNLTYTLTAAVG